MDITKIIFFSFFLLTKHILQLSPFTTNTSSKLDVLGHNGHPLSMDSTEIGILKQSNKISFSSFLKSKYSMALEPQISLEVLCNFTNKTLEGQLPDQELSTLLILTNFTESNSSRAVSMGFLDSTSGWCRLPCSLGCELLPWSLSTGGFASGLLGTSHVASRKTN
uniref:Uncharacterized protein n=1 Tax=Lotus japonicus TaxID=34305 RepID=I3S2S1_LOTJA|nr:unknown [Lotus japonicus]